MNNFGIIEQAQYKNNPLLATLKQFTMAKAYFFDLLASNSLKERGLVLRQVIRIVNSKADCISLKLNLKCQGADTNEHGSADSL